MEIIRFSNEAEWLEARRQDVTSTDIAALLGLSEYKTRFALWHEKAGNYTPEFVENESMKWGKRFENTIAHGICEDRDWQAEDLNLVYIRDPELKIGSSYDIKIKTPEYGKGIMEVKNVSEPAFNKSWSEDAAPIYYELQLMTELHLGIKADVGLDFGVMAAMIGGNRYELYFRDPDFDLWNMIEDSVGKFWDSIRAGDEPDPDWQADAKVLDAVRPVVKGKEIDLTGNNRIAEALERYDRNFLIIKDAEERREQARNDILNIIGDANRAIVGETHKITVSRIDGGQVSYYKEPYRQIRITKTERSKK